MPDIVYVDNDPETFTHLIPEQEEDRIGAFVYSEDYPAEDALEPAKEARVWLFDFFLVEPSHAQSKDENGLSLFQKWQAAVAGGRPTTVLISSALESAVKEPLGPEERHHVVAQRRGVEWIGDKSAKTWRRLAELADAAVLISNGLEPSQEEGKALATYDLEHLCFDVLGVEREAQWSNSAQRQVDRARPPREVPAAPAATARVIIAWIISHVLPYPSFLLTDAQAALRLRIAPQNFREIVDADAMDSVALRDALAKSEYRGPLANFLGRRWWRAGVDDLVWKLSESEIGYRAAFKALAGDTAVTWLEHSEPVLVSTEDLVETDEVAEANDCVRVTDEDFPASVDPGWVRIGVARDNRELRAKVVFEDRELVSTDL